MIINTLIIFTSELKIYLNNRKFKWVNLILIFLSSFLVILSLPYTDEIKTQMPLNGLIFTNSIIIILSYYNLKTLNGGLEINKSLTGVEWKKNKGYSYKSIYSGIFFSRVLFNIIFLISILPVGILVISLGGITFSKLLSLYIFTFLLTSVCTSLGIFVREFFSKMRGLVTTYIYLLFLLLYVFTSFFQNFY